MNKIFVAASVAALSLTLTLPVSSYAAGAESVVAQAQKKAVKTVTFNVGMHCQNCVKKVKENISFETEAATNILFISEKFISKV